MPIVGSNTKSVQDGLNRVNQEFKGISISTVDILDFSNEIYQIVGTSTLFDWSLATGTTFGTTANVQDYANVPADLRRLVEGKVWINDDSSTFTPMIPLKVREQLPKTNTRGRPQAISIENGSFRLFPMPNITRTVSGQWAIIFEYSKKPKLLSALGDLFEFDDIYFPVYSQGLIARVAKFIDDERAGAWGGRHPVTGQFFGTGFWGDFAVQLNNMVREEELSSGQTIWAPSESIFM